MDIDIIFNVPYTQLYLYLKIFHPWDALYGKVVKWAFFRMFVHLEKNMARKMSQIKKKKW